MQRVMSQSRHAKTGVQQAALGRRSELVPDTRHAPGPLPGPVTFDVPLFDSDGMLEFPRQSRERDQIPALIDSLPHTQRIIP